MYKTIVIQGDVLTSRNKNTKSYVEGLNTFFSQNPDIEIIDIHHITENHDYTAIIIYKEKE